MTVPSESDEDMGVIVGFALPYFPLHISTFTTSLPSRATMPHAHVLTLLHVQVRRSTCDLKVFEKQCICRYNYMLGSALKGQRVTASTVKTYH